MASIRRIEIKPIPNRYARGWHCLGLASDYDDGKPHSINAFGTHLVGFRGADGKVHILDGYCPHMGADLCRGTIRDNSLVCAFHQWSWGGDGVCNEVPYSKRIPPAARIQSWSTCEENKLLFVWNDPEGKPPRPELAIPRIEACFSDEWSDWMVRKWTVNTNCREVIDNVSDMIHFTPIHGIPIAYFANIFEGHKASQVMLGRSPGQKGGLMTYSTFYGPSYQIAHMKGELGGIKMDSIVATCNVPIDLKSFELSFSMLVRKLPDFSSEQNLEMAKTFVALTQIGFQQDVDMWLNKTRIDNPLLTEGDGPIYQLHRWYDQFFIDEAEVAQEVRERFVVETNPGGVDPPPPVHHVFEE